MNPKADLLLEASWEVCNKVGGINTVLKSKAAKIVSYYGENYYLIGPYFAKQTVGEFEETLPKGNLKEVADFLKKEGVICHFGKWLIDGTPECILIDFTNSYTKLNEVKKNMWDWYKIDSLNVSHDYDEPVAWSYAVFLLIQKIAEIFKDKKIVAQFHEWLTGAALLHLTRNKINIGTVFTTHATVLGRTLSSNNIELYSFDGKTKCALELMDIEKEAYNYGVAAKHQIEKNSAVNADVFTTVSEITGMEAKFILGRKPDVLLPNGLDIEKFPTFEEISIKHRLQRDSIREFILYYFFPYYVFELKETLFYFIAGRYEFHDKGVDIFIKSLGNLNERMKKEKSKKTIVAFIWVPANIRGIKPELLESRTFFKDIKDNIEDNINEIQKLLMFSLVSQFKITENSLFEPEFILEMKKKVLKLKKSGTPPVSTHDILDDNDVILRGLREAKLENKAEDNVKIVFYPIYLSGADSLLDLSYYEAMQGSHLGVFPSFYEPWGYTPLEAGALGVSSVTTDLAGFGRYIAKKTEGKKNPGVFVLKRMGRSEGEVVSDLADILYYFATLKKQMRIENKMAARRLAEMADWSILIKNYIKAHEKALK